MFFNASCQSGLCFAWIPSNLFRVEKKTEKGVKPEVRGVSVSPDSEEAEVLESDPGDGSVPKVANSAVQSRQVARNHSHVSRVAGEGRGDKTYSKTFWIQLVGFAK